jgi:hypothetical protein
MSNDLPQGDTVTPGESARLNGSEPDGATAPTQTTQPWPLLGGVVAGIAALLAVVRIIRSRRQPSADERLVEAAQSLGSAAVGLGGRAARRTAAVAQPVARDAAALTVVAAQDAAGFAAEEARKVAAAAAGGVREVAEGVESVQKAWSKLVRRLTILVFGSAGYVLGARAGRGRYDQIAGLATRAKQAVQGGSQ